MATQVFGSPEFFGNFPVENRPGTAGSVQEITVFPNDTI